MRKTDDTIILKMLEEGKTQTEIAKYFNVSPAAICKRLKRIKPLPESFENLTEKEREFTLQVSEGKSQTEAALLSHDCSSRDSAKSLGCSLMKKPDIQIAVAELMQEEGLTRRHRVYKLKKHVDNVDPGVSLKALDQSWKLDGAYAPQKVEIDLRSIHADVAAIKALSAEQEAGKPDRYEALNKFKKFCRDEDNEDNEGET